MFASQGGQATNNRASRGCQMLLRKKSGWARAFSEEPIVLCVQPLVFPVVLASGLPLDPCWRYTHLHLLHVTVCTGPVF